MKKGILITIEGGDGAGKTTLMQHLYEELKKKYKHVIETRAPGGTKAGAQIREILLERSVHLTPHAELLLFVADRAQHVEELIQPALMEGKIVLCDRFNDSTIAYQAGARGLNKKLVKELCQFASLGIKPHLTLYLDIDPKIGYQRNMDRAQDRIEAETLQFHQKIRKCFRQIAKEEPKRFFLIDASKPKEEVLSLAKERVGALLKPCR